MNSATGHFTTSDPFKEYACTVTLTEEKIINAGPTLIYVSVQEFPPDKPKPIGNTLSLCQTKIDLVLSATYATTEACYGGFDLLPLLNKAKACHATRRHD
jgi:hypothetical protein